MRLTRIAPALAAGAVLLASVAPAQAQTDEDPPGVATTVGGLTVLGVDAGSLLSLDLLTDAATANTDPAVGVPSALAQISALVIDSPALGVSESLPVLSVQSTDGTDTQATEMTPIDNPVLSGTILPIALEAVVSDVGATSSISAGLVDIDVLGGIATLAGTQLGLGGEALTAESDALRGVDVDALTVLDLEALLSGLGIPLADLPLGTLLDLLDSLGLLSELGALLDQLGIPVDLENLSAGALLAAIDDVRNTLDAIAASQGLSGVGELADAADSGELATLLDEGGLDDVADLVDSGPTCDVLDLLATCGGVVQTVDDLVSGDVVNAVLGLTDQLQGALEAPLGLLDDVSLLSLDGLNVGVVTKATNDVGTSIADVTGTLGALSVGGLGLGELDLLATAEQLNATLAQAQSTIGGILGQIDPSLSNLVNISTLEETTSIVQSETGAITATAAFTGLRVDVLPELGELLAFIQNLAGVESVADSLTALGVPVPAGATEMVGLNGLLGGVPTAGIFDNDVVFALTEGLTIEVASLSQTSTFGAVSAPVPALPTTGSNDTLILTLGAALAAAALVARRRLTTPIG